MDEYFENILRKVVESSLTKKPLSVDLLTSDALMKYPNKLYKFKSLSEGNRGYTFQMLQKEYLWASHPKDFSDPNDSKIKLRSNEKEAFGRWIEKHFAEILFYELAPRGVMEGQKYGMTVQTIRDHQNDFSGGKGKTKLRKLTSILEQMDIAESLKKQLLCKFKQIIDIDSIQSICGKIDAQFCQMTSSFQKNSFVASVTNSYQNNMLWERYSDDFSGIVIEYTIPSFDKLSDEVKGLLLHLFPVEYRTNCPKVTLMPLFDNYFQKEYYKENVDCIDSSIEIYKQVLYKKREYNGEAEWRFVDCVNTNIIPFPFISRVIAGYKTEAKDLVELKEICDEKGIELWIQKNDELMSELQYCKYVES